MLDVLGQELSLGDRVAAVSKRYKTLHVGTITGFTPKKAWVHTEIKLPLEHWDMLVESAQVVKLEVNK